MRRRGEVVGRWVSGALLALLGLLCAGAQAASPRALNEYFRETWTTRQGLPHNLVQGIAQTPDGYLWFATWEGVARYNGLEFKTFDRGNTPALGDNGVRSLRVSADGALWLGTSRGGVSRYAQGRWSQLSMRDGMAQDEIMDILPTPSGGLWIATESAGLDRYDGKSFHHFRKTDGLPSDAMYSLALEPDGTLWVGTTEGLARVRGDTVEAFGAAQGMPPGPVFSLFLAPDGTLFVGTEHGPYKRNALRFEKVSPDLPEDTIPRLRMDATGALWIGTVNYGLLRYRDGKVENLGSLAGLPNNRVAALFEDREGSIWVGTNGGLLRLRDAPFGTYTTEHGLSDDYIRSLLETKDNTLWVGTSRGLSRYKDGKFSVLSRADGLPGDSILSLATARAGGIWMGTYANGLVRWDNGVKEVRGSDGGLAGNQVRAITEGKDGSVWAGTSRGLSHVINGKVHNFNVADGLPREYITSLMAAADGRIWVGTANGAAVIDGEKIQALDMHELDEAEDVFGFHEDADGTMWMASDRGLVRYRKGKLSLVGRRQGLPVDTIFQVIEDRDQHFWLTSNRGVLHLSRADAEAAADGKVQHIPVEVFGEADGMASAQCNGGSGPSAGISHEGRVWVATAKGLSVVDPERLAGFARQQPPVVIEDVRVDDRSLPTQEHLDLAAGTRKVELHFAGLSYLMPQKIRYRYRLDGFDDEWVERGTLRFAQYTNLDPGEYRFRVNAANPDGLWNSQEAGLSFDIQPFFWQRPLFWFLVAAVTLFIMLAAYRWRIHQLRVNERRLKVLVEQRTTDLREQTQRLTVANDEKSLLVERLRLQAEASERQAREDALTGLANRRYFDERLADEFARACRDRQPLSLALLDVDNFKRINDGWSHAVGDAALKAVAAVMRAETRGVDVVARYGGEEFALLFPRTTREEAMVLSERLREAVMRCDFSDFAQDLKISVSIGVSDREGLAHHERMVSRADTHLYEAKDGGRNQVRG